MKENGEAGCWAGHQEVSIGEVDSISASLRTWLEYRGEESLPFSMPSIRSLPALSAWYDKLLHSEVKTPSILGELGGDRMDTFSTLL